MVNQYARLSAHTNWISCVGRYGMYLEQYPRLPFFGLFYMDVYTTYSSILQFVYRHLFNLILKLPIFLLEENLQIHA